LSLIGAKTVYSCREILSKEFGTTPERVIFTKNCTEALNLAIFGTLKDGDHVITTVYEHNSVLRPLYHLERQGKIRLSIVSPNQDGELLPQIEKAIVGDTKLIITTSISNVNGEILPVKEIGFLAKKHGVFYVVDGAQGGGHIPLKATDGISAIALAGHKGLYGIMGSGALILANDFDLSPLIFGGTGSESFNPFQPDCYPEKLESGTLNLPAIASLNEGVRYASTNLEHFGKQLYLRTQTLIENLKSINGVKCYSFPNPSGIVAFSLKSLSSEACADLLNANYDVAVRGGFHCAPLMHKFLKTQSNGLVRASIAVQNSSSEINYFVSAVKELAKNN
jgi:selenocysteine lyase/cysteine desulfurase